ncbi:DUF1501 domain-containing protein [Thiothrix fructosivorans]|jgi:hypothetical protein|uniref:DUF1501 domain-containing protein n=1 Tax=Thiothrix fructosivorans TaxID=111770 RepID=A0A8B0SJV2_9GAMM|nr:DUF1501 domain-containing protein [Thiothrix fructosivorans]MBO0611586.1 DUF1501 domain-containing protein [Thiothrix fructosivorans]QTX10750.1 DUF1501 domain-containing protein [Thiothrix fructosivorans]
MNRRDFLKLASAASLASVLAGAGRSAYAANLHTGKVLLTIHLGGGWDHSSFSDPRENPAINQWASTLKAGGAGNLRFAPMAENTAFFNKYYNSILVINGIDIQTNGHDAASRTRNTGNLMDGFPSTNELYAAAVGAALPMPFVRQGGFDSTVGIMPFTALPDENLLRTLANPNFNSGTKTYYAPSHLDLLHRYEQDRLTVQQQQPDNLPRWQRKLEELQRARVGSADIKALGTVLPATLDTNDLAGMKRNGIRELHMFLVLAAAGMTATGSFGTGGWDSHGNHDNAHTNTLTDMTRLLDYLWTKADSMGLGNRLVVHVTSDVGRTPNYNATNGKDHWSLGSDFIMAKNAPWANRIVGVSGPAHQRVKINPNTLLPDNNGVYLQTKHIHTELRKLLGIDSHALAQRYSLKAEAMALFNPAVSSGIRV